MGELREKHTIFGPFPDWDPIDTALLFLRTNRYQLDVEERGAPPDELTTAPLAAEEAGGGPVDVDVEGGEPAGADDDGEAARADDADEEGEAASPPEADDADASGADNDSGADAGAETSSPAESDEARDEGGPADDGREDVEVEAASQESGDARGPGERPDEVVVRAVVKRGKSGSGYFTSNMSELPTTLTLELDRNTLRVEYLVDTSGQFMRDDEREFWRKEARALEAFVKGASAMMDVADQERERAQAARADLLTVGLWAAGIVFFLIFVGGVILFRV